MSFDHLSTPPRKIAVIGAGISGMGAAFALSGTHRVSLFESENRLGGHARTVMAGKRGDQPVDTGFIVFNHVNYPNLVELFQELDVPTAKSQMSFGVSVRDGWLDYALNDLDSLFAQRSNLVNPKFLAMVRDIFRFNKHAQNTVRPGMTVRDLIATLGLGSYFRDYYLTPFSGAIWSTPKEKILDFPADALIRFFANHHLLHHTGQHQWHTVQGGSVEYVSRLETRLRADGVALRLGTPIKSVSRHPAGVTVRAWGVEPELFDEVIFATHSDDSLKMLEDATGDERRDLGAIAYQPNDIVLHCDESLMPANRKVWSSWTYTEPSDMSSDVIDLSYWMNALQPIPQSDPHFVTLNSRRPIREELIYDQVSLRHPVYNAEAFKAQARVAEWNGANNTWFCGAWMKNGFHEDGLSSALDVVDAIKRIAAAKVAAE